MTAAHSRRSFLTGALSLLAAPAIIRVAPIMPVRVLPPAVAAGGFTSAELEAISNAVLRRYLREAYEQILVSKTESLRSVRQILADLEPRP